MENIITAKERKTIFDNMVKLLDEYDYEYSDSALYKIIDTWAEQKSDLIALFKKHPNYVEGKFMITFNSDWSREINTDGARRFARWIYSSLPAIRDNLPDYVKELVAKEATAQCHPLESYSSSWPFGFNADFIYTDHRKFACQFVDEDTEVQFNRIDPSLRFKSGQKMSRAINKICHWLGIDKLPDYNQEFAKYADSVNPIKVVRHTIISINPIDYLTMSFGNSWASCHTIDKENRRGMPNSYEGQYSSGTISYMIDKVSMVFYTVSADYDGDEYYFEPKINRNMFHYGEDKLIQGRVYPQDNDSSGSIYNDIRAIVQKVMADCLGIPNLWETKKGPDEIRPYVWSAGTNYPDYNYFSNCRVSFPKEKEMNSKRITIGHKPICINCGYEHDISENIDHCNAGHICENCGGVITDPDDVYWVGDYCYCRDCVTYCECCNEYVRDNDVTWVEDEDRYVCDDCLERYYERCDHCGEWFDRDNMTELASGDWACADCLDDYYYCCNECEKWFPEGDICFDDDGVAYCDSCWEKMEENEEEE